LTLDIPIDTVGLNGDFALFAEGLHWCTPHDAYRALARDQLAAIIEEWGLLDPDSDAAKICAVKLSYINHDLVRLGCLAMDAANIQVAGTRPRYNAGHNPLFNELFTGMGRGAISFARNDWPQSRGSEWTWLGKVVAKRFLRRLQGFTSAPHVRVDVLGRNELANRYLETSGKAMRDLFAYLLDAPMPRKAQPDVTPLAETIAQRFMTVAKPHLSEDQGLLGRVHEAARGITHAHLGQAWVDLGRLRASGFAGRPAKVLVSGTPKYLGRLLSLYYREQGAEVHRFAHGGERAFFDDPEWGPNEFTYCDRYHCYSRGEAENTQRRFAEGRVPRIGNELPVFIGDGSTRHREINAIPAVRSGNGKSILYLPNNYTGEALYLAPYFRANDVLYTEWQIWLLTTLREMGYEVTIKFHPGEAPGNVEMLSRYAHRADSGSFDLARFNDRCLLFDFAGTAFFDALASPKSVALIDSGIRPLDPTARRDLAERCALVSGYTDERNRFRVDTEDLRDAIMQAMDSPGCSPTFFEKYYCASRT
jgi:hypothetical protein